MKWLIAGLAGVAGIVVIAAAFMISLDSTDAEESANFSGQGGEGELLAVDGARLVRSTDGIQVRVVVPTPKPGTYEYPKGDDLAGWATPHPEVQPGDADGPEVFTRWAVVFNNPELCTDQSCDRDDLAPDPEARGGVYQADGRIADSSKLQLIGSVRIGQIPSTGSLLDNPLGAEVHLAIAPHGRALTGQDLQRQLNGPLGNPTLWWAAEFPSLP
jgi:hypothetical protein